MATVEAKNLRVRSENPITVYQWNLTPGDEPAAVEVNPSAACSVQVAGMFDGGEIDIMGSIDGDAFVPLKDKIGAYVSFSEEGIATLGQAVRLVKPNNLLGGAGAVSVTIITGSAS